MRADVVALDLPMSSAAPALARRAVEALRLDGSARETVRLLASELVTNAVVHSGAARSAVIRVSAEIAGETLRLSVTDAGSGAGPVAPSERPGMDGGFGLLLLDELAARWGVERRGATTVWCEVAVCGGRPAVD
jgi:anti-sigma regulatory factor (Ser/Thr protein kinase)